MFTLPQPVTLDNVDERHDGLPLIDLEEDSRTLDHIVTLCHPSSCTGQQFKVNSLRELRDVLEATKKYDMEIVRGVALEQLTNPSILSEDPLGIYALACQYECDKAAQSAAKYTLALPSLVRAYVPDLDKIHAGKLYRLLSYREACITAACSMASDHTWILYTNFLPIFDCRSWECEDVKYTKVRNPPSRKYRTGRVESISVHKWWLEYMTKSEHSLQRSPHGDTVKDEELVNDALEAISASNCKQYNSSQVAEAFRSFVHFFAENIERRIAEVQIDLGF